MKRVLILVWSLCLIGCNSQTKNGNLDDKAYVINLKFKNESVVFEGINSVNDNANEDFNIKNDGTKVLIEPAFLESDLLDGKVLKFSNGNVRNVKITFYYDAVFYGEEKNKKRVGFQRDTTILLKIENKKVQIPSFEDIKKAVFKKFEKKEIYDAANLVNQNYFNKIVENYDAYGGKDSPDYKSAVAFLKSKRKFQKLEDLFINIDYIKFNIEFEDNLKSHFCVVFDRMFQKYISEKEKNSNIKEQPPIDFFDQKYFNGYMISFGDEDISEHPYRYYYNYENKKIQWFAISYVPKDISLHKYWSNYLQKSSSNEATQSSTIEKIINKDLSSYNIFAVYIPKKYLDISNGESEEAMFFKNNTELYFYLYDTFENKWKFLKKAQTNGPLIGQRDFFCKQFPELFSSDKVLKLNDNRNIAYSYDFDLDQDGIKDKIILYTNDGEKGEFERIHFGLPMEIKKGLPDKTYQIWYNNNLIIRKNNFNCATEGFSRIVSKDNYFTIESQICSDYIEISSYITFKVIGENILLYKYSETYFDKANHERIIPQKTWGVKDFHNVNFEDVTDDFLIKLIQVKPKK